MKKALLMVMSGVCLLQVGSCINDIAYLGALSGNFNAGVALIGDILTAVQDAIV